MLDLILIAIIILLIVEPPFLSDEYISELNNFCKENLTNEETNYNNN